MSHKRDQDRLDALISQAVDLGKIEFDRKKWLDRLARAQQRPALTGSRVDNTQLNNPGTIWRKIMESKITKYSAAAVIALAAAVVLLNPFGASPHGVALAAVREKVAQVDTMVLRGEKTFTCVAEPNLVLRFDSVMYISKQYGTMEEGRMNGALVYRIIANRPEKQFLFLLPVWKKCLKRPWTEGQSKILEKLTPTGVMDLVLEAPYRKLGPAQIDGRAAEGFEIQDIQSLRDILPKYLIDIQQGTATFWVGTQELLPIRLEGDLLIGKSALTLFTDLRHHVVANLESYNVKLDEELFSTEIPEGYTEFKLIDLVGGKFALAGLGILPVGALAWRRRRARNNKVVRNTR
jgi:hypothetical protein